MCFCGGVDGLGGGPGCGFGVVDGFGDDAVAVDEVLAHCVGCRGEQEGAWMQVQRHCMECHMKCRFVRSGR